MKGIATLIRLAKRNLDELRRKQVQLETQKEQLHKAVKKLRDELAQESSLAARTQEMAGFYGGFAKRMREREENLHAEIQKIDTELAALSEQITDAFADLKKYEIAQDMAKKRAQEESSRHETIAMDELAGQQFARKQKQDQGG